MRFLQNMFLLINFNIISRTYCLNETTLILSVAFLLSVSRNIMYPQHMVLCNTDANFGLTGLLLQLIEYENVNIMLNLRKESKEAVWL